MRILLIKKRKIIHNGAANILFDECRYLEKEFYNSDLYYWLAQNTSNYFYIRIRDYPSPDNPFKETILKLYLEFTNDNDALIFKLTKGDLVDVKNFT